MKDHTFLFITAFMVLMVCHPSAAQRVRHVDLEYHISDFATTSSGGMLHVSAPGFAYVYDTDTLAPALPLACVYVLVGPGETLEGFNASGSTETLLDSVDLAPNPISIPTNRTAPAKVIHPVHYTNPTYPENRAVFTGVHDMGGYRVLSFLVSPLTYSPTTRTLCITPRMRLTLELQGPGRQSQTLQSGMASVVRNLVSNPSDIETLYGVAPEPRATASGSTPTISDAPLQYLIVTCDSLKSEFQRLADWKTAKGVKATVITVEDIYSTYTGRNNQLKIKQAIKHHYDTSGSQLQYVLLGGDKNIVPVQNCYNELVIFNSITSTLDTLHVNSSSDVFYACLADMEWDTNGNGRYAELEDSVNLTPLLCVTRMPSGNRNEASDMVNRIICYERNPDKIGWNYQMLTCGVDKEFYHIVNDSLTSYTHDMCEAWASEYLDDWHGGIFRFYDTGTDNILGGNYDVTAQNLQAELEKGYMFANMFVHGDRTFWLLENSIYNTFNASSLSNPNATLLFTDACYTNDMNINFSLANSILKNSSSGILLYYGSSDKGISFANDVGPSEELIGKTYQRLFGDLPNIGNAIRQSKMGYLSMCNSYTDQRFLHLFMNALCDPEMMTFSSVPSKFPNISFSHYNDNFILNPGDDRPYWCIMSRHDNGQSLYLYKNSVNSNGTNSFGGLSGEYNVWLYGGNHIPYHGIIGPNVYLQNEAFDDNINITADRSYVGSNVASDRTNGPVVIEKGDATISSRYGVTISDSFEVKPGATLEITTNQPINQ